jgi:hypothetical protein
MSVIVPTATTFKARHPRFASVSDDTVTLYLADAFTYVNDCWNETDATNAVMYLAAHKMIMEGALAPTKVALGVGNQISRVKAGEVETEFATGAKPDGISGKLWATYGGTFYGQQYLDLAARNGGQSDAAVLVV